MTQWRHRWLLPDQNISWDKLIEEVVQMSIQTLEFARATVLECQTFAFKFSAWPDLRRARPTRWTQIGGLWEVGRPDVNRPSHEVRDRGGDPVALAIHQLLDERNWMKVELSYPSSIQSKLSFSWSTMPTSISKQFLHLKLPETPKITHFAVVWPDPTGVTVSGLSL